MTAESQDIPSTERQGSLELALAHTHALLATQPALAAEQAGEILRAVPGHPQARLYLATALRLTGEDARARTEIEALAAEQPRSAVTLAELGMARAAAGEMAGAMAALRRAVQLRPDFADAWRSLGDLHTALGEDALADAAYAAQIKASTRDPRLLAAAAALADNQLADAEARLREHLRQHPTDVAALRMLAEVAGRIGRYHDAGNLLLRCLELAPSFHAARHNLAIVLSRQNKPAEALEQIDQLLAAEPHNPAYRNVRATILARIGDSQESIRIYADLLKSQPLQAGIWMNYGHALNVAGQEKDSIQAYRECIAREARCGEAYWSLANLKTFRFQPAEVEAMRAQVRREDLTVDERFHFHFALGKALEDAREYEAAFRHYETGNRLRRETIEYDPDEVSDQVRRARLTLTRQFFEERAGTGCPAPDPIFIVGLPRSGSTLVEQILASHSAIEGTMELPDIMALAKRLEIQSRKAGGPGYPEALAALDAEECRSLGEQYLERTRVQRRAGKPRFIDKMPNNFLHVGLIRLALPNARIIDVRRNPMACCFSGYKQHFARGQHFTYSLQELGRYYRDYVDLMQHFDAALPGAVHRVVYEELVEDTEGGVRRLLEYCGLPFEESCLRFYENARSVRTASAQQVRKPIYKDGVDHWRNFEPWLEPLRNALGPVVDSYPEAPALHG